LAAYSLESSSTQDNRWLGLGGNPPALFSSFTHQARSSQTGLTPSGGRDPPLSNKEGRAEPDALFSDMLELPCGEDLSVSQRPTVISGGNCHLLEGEVSRVDGMPFCIYWSPLWPGSLLSPLPSSVLCGGCHPHSGMSSSLTVWAGKGDRVGAS
jgi:hypothetical protein